MNREFDDIEEFHIKFGLIDPRTNRPTFLDPPDMLFRMGFMLEEITELGQAYLKEDMAKVADALVDLAYIVLGTACLMRLPWEELWNAVHAANMNKERSQGRSAKRGSALDVVKPPGWEPPDLETILKLYGWSR